MTARAHLTSAGRSPVQAPVAALMILAATTLVSAQTRQPLGMTRKKPSPEARVVQFETEDGVTIEADYYAPTAKDSPQSPVAILIHMYSAKRASWGPLVGDLRKAGFAVLAYDIRGTGGSKKPARMKLKQGYKSKDPEHFNKAWKDVEGAKEWLGNQLECDITRIALVGASIGCSISLQYASRDQDVKAVVCLSPGTNYFGVDSLGHIKKCGERPILLISPESEYDAVKELMAASGGVAKGKKFAGTRKLHGTKLLTSEDGKKANRRITAFLKKAFRKKKEEVDEQERPTKTRKRRTRNM